MRRCSKTGHWEMRAAGLHPQSPLGNSNAAVDRYMPGGSLHHLLHVRRPTDCEKWGFPLLKKIRSEWPTWVQMFAMNDAHEFAVLHCLGHAEKKPASTVVAIIDSLLWMEPRKHISKWSHYPLLISSVLRLPKGVIFKDLVLEKRLNSTSHFNMRPA